MDPKPITTTRKLLTNTDKLFEALSVFQVKLAINPKGTHYGAHIELLDFLFNKEHLITRLRESLIDWVFAKRKAREIFESEFGPKHDFSSAAAKLYNAARETVRVTAPQGQFGELLLSAFIQHLFHAAPLLRKQPVRTSDNHERYGADAIHYSNDGGHNLYLGEAKCYKSSYRFSPAFAASLESLNTTLSEFATEIRKFSTGGFIEDELKPIAEQLLSNKLTGLTIHPVAIVIYNETGRLAGDNAEEIKEAIRTTISSRCDKIDPALCTLIDEKALTKMTFIIMPVWELDQLLEDFVKAL